jgi:copper(I)-binding protein
MKIFRTRWLMLLLLLCSAWLAHALVFAGVNVMTLTDGWVRAMPPGMKMTAAFGTLANEGGGPLELLAWHSDAFDDVTLHRTVIEDGVSRMREVETMSLAPGEALVMEPGGYHLMLMAPSRTLAPGDALTLGVTTSGGQRFEFEVPLKKR